MCSDESEIVRLLAEAAAAPEETIAADEVVRHWLEGYRALAARWGRPFAYGAAALSIGFMAEDPDATPAAIRRRTFAAVPRDLLTEAVKHRRTMEGGGHATT